MKKNAIISAPLYAIIGSIVAGQTELKIRVMPLKKALLKDGNYFYPSHEGTKKITAAMLGQIDKSDFTNKDVTRKAYRSFCTKANIESTIVLANAVHNNKGHVVAVVKTVVVVKEKVQPVKKTEKEELAQAAQAQMPVVKSIVASNSKFAKKDQNDIDAINQYLAGNRDAFSPIYKRYYDIILQKYSIKLKFNHELAEDLVGDFFMNLLEKDKLASYKSDFTFNSWITKASDNFFIDYTRRKKLDTVSIDAGLRVNNDESENTEIQIADTDELSAVELLMREEGSLMDKDFLSKSTRQFVKQLPEKQKEVWILRGRFGMDFKEIAEMTGVSINTALGQMRYAVINIRKMVQGQLIHA